MGNNKKPPINLDEILGPPSKVEQKRIMDNMNKRMADWAKKRRGL